MSVIKEDIINCMKEMELNIDFDNLLSDKNLNDQGIDSLDMMNFFFNLEERFSVKISEESIESGKWETINDIVTNINSLK